MVAVAPKNYNLAEGSLSINGAIIAGGGPDEFISAVRDNDFVEAETSSDGSQATFSITNDKMGTVTITLQQTSDANQTLNDLSKLQETDGTGVFSFQWTNSSDGSKITGTDCRIIKAADYTGGKVVGTREWAIKVLDLSFDS